MPLLQRLRLKDQNQNELAISDFTAAFADTIMTQTGKPRPINTWSGRLENFDKISKLPIKDITCLSVGPSVASVLLTSPDSLFPKLDTVIIGGRSQTDCAFMKFAESRPIERFKLVNVQSNEIIDQSISNEIVKSLSKMSMLKFINLFFRDSLFQTSRLLPAQSWPRLEFLMIQCTFLTEKELATILAAAPSCRVCVLTIDSESISKARMLAMILFYCPNIVRINLRSDGSQEIVESIKEARDAFAQYPITSSSAQLLVEFVMPHFNGSASVFHYVLNQLASTGAPRLSIVSLGPAAVGTLELCIVRCLSHIRLLEQICTEDGEQINPQIAVLRLAPVTKHILKRWTHGEASHNSFDNQFYGERRTFSYADSVEGILVEIYGGEKSYFAIKSSIFEALCTLAAWDAGKYNV